MKQVVVVLTLILSFACGKKKESIVVENGSITEAVYGSGKIKAIAQYTACLPVSGIIKKVYVQEGDLVKKGDAILSLDHEAQKVNLANARSNADYAMLKANAGKLEEAKALVDFTFNKFKLDSLNYLRQLNLYQNQIGSQLDLEQKQLNYKNAISAYISAHTRYLDLKRQLALNAKITEGGLEISKQQTQDFTLYSDVDGRVYEILKKAGELSQPQMPLAVIGSDHSFLLELQVDEYDVTKIALGQQVMVKLDSYKGKVFEAKVSKIIPIMNERTKSFAVEALFTNAPPVLYPNLSFEANIVIQTKQNVLLIPRNYLVNDSFVVKENGEKIAVNTGLMDYQKVEILKGVSANETLQKP